MRELISEATRTVEDSQTAQALHGLLSLKSPADCMPPAASSSVASSLLTSVGELSMAELIQQASAGANDYPAAALQVNQWYFTCENKFYFGFSSGLDWIGRMLLIVIEGGC